ncbi:MAG: MerR family transcriptional regulator [Elusimicrobiales bacterium]
MRENKNYFTIDEVSRITGLKKHTIRYWEKKFSIIKPIRLSSKHRRYTRLDIENIEKIKKMISEGFSTQGIKKAIKSKTNITTNPDNTNYKILLEKINKEIKEIIKNL